MSLKKLGLSLLLLLCGSLLAFGAGSGESTGADEDVEITIMGPIVPQYRFDAFEQFTQKLHEEYPNITVVLESIPGWAPTEEQVLVQYASGGGPDIVQSGESGAVLEFASRGMLEPLDSYGVKYPALHTSTFFEAPIAMAQFDGKTYGLPQNGITEVLYYNKELLREAGLSRPPATKEEVIEYARKISDLGDDIYGLNYNMNAWGFTTFLYLNGGKWLSDDNKKMLFAETEGQVALQTMVDCINTWKVTPPIDADAQKMWLSGKIGMVIGHPWYYGLTNTNSPDMEFTASALPGPTYSSAHWVSILSNSEHKDEAAFVLSWLMSDEMDIVYHDTLNFLPGKKDTWSLEPFSSIGVWVAFGKQLSQNSPMPAFPGAREMITLSTTHVEKALAGQESVERTLQLMENDIAKLLNN
jgi:multiple sugar transport system substrate-binding protein